MAVERFLGGAWAAVHGPGEARALLLWTLEQGFRGLVPGPGPRQRDWRALRGPLASLPARIAAVRVGGILDLETPAALLASTNAADRRAAMARVGDVVALARTLGCARIVLDPGVVKVRGELGQVDIGDSSIVLGQDQATAQLARRNAQLSGALDAVCRSLHALCKAFPDIVFCLTASRHLLGLGEPHALGAIFEDLAAQPLAYWHDAPLAARRRQLLGTEPGEWLQSFANRMVGMTLGDTSDGQLYLPPGAGTVDYPLLASYIARSGKPLTAALELDPGVEASELTGVHAFLSKFGL